MRRLERIPTIEKHCRGPIRKESALPLWQKRESDKSDSIKCITLGKTETSEGDKVTDVILKQKKATPRRMSPSAAFTYVALTNQANWTADNSLLKSLILD